MKIMKKILSVFPVALIILALLTCGGETMAQQQGGRDRANKEVNQSKQKGKVKAKEADEALKKEQEKAREAAQKEEEKAREAIQKEDERVREAVKDEDERVREGVKDEEERAREAMKNEEERVREGMKNEEEMAREAGQKEKERMRETYGDRKDQERGKGRGNAYGRNKGGLEGRDFGQARAEEARMKNQEKKTELDRKVEDGEQRTVQARERIRVAREELEKEKSTKRIADDVYQQKKEKIDNAEKAVIDLEEKIRRGKSVPGEI